MKLVITVFIFMFIFGFSQIAEAQTNQEIKVQVNKQKAVAGKNLIVKFVSVLEDSRCPKGTDCIWAGNAKIQIKLKKKTGAWKTFELNTNLDKNEIVFGGYSIKISELTPSPAENVRINSNSYIATLNIAKM